MSRVSKNAIASPLGAFVAQLSENFKHGDAAQVGMRAELPGMVASLESLDESKLAIAADAIDVVTSSIKTSMEGAYTGQGMDPTTVSLENFQVEAGALVGAGFADITAIGNALRGPRNAPNDAVVVSPLQNGAAGIAQFGAALHTSLESFDDQEINKYKEFSVAFNVLASRQDAFGEALFPTQVASADQAGLEGRINRAIVFRPATRNSTGAAMDLKERNLIEGYADDSVLSSDVTRIYPMVTAGAEGNFVDTGLVANQSIVVEGQSIDTNYLAFGKEFDIIGLSQTDAVIRNGAPDHTDALDRAPAMDKILVNLVVNNDPGTGVVATPTPVEFDVRHLGRSEFIPQREGDTENQLALNFPLVGLRVTGATTAVDGSALPADFKALLDAGVELVLGTTLTGGANLRSGLVGANATELTVVAAYAPDGTQLDLGAGAAAAALAGIVSMTAVGYKVEAYRSNLNLRSEGHLLDTRTYAELYPAQLGAPLTSQKAISTDAGKNGALLEVLVNAARIRTSNNAVVVLQNFAALMKGLVSPTTHTVPASSVQDFGLGRFLITPYYQEKDLDLTAGLNSTKAHERAKDVQGVIVNTIRSLAYDMFQACGYGVALDSMTGGAGSIPNLVIATDEKLERHVQIDGDLRVAGPKMTYDIVSSSNKKVKNKIYLTFVRKGVTGVDPLSFGFHVWQPELVTRAQVTRGGSHGAETIIQPRSTQYISMPVLCEITVSNLEEALEDQTGAPA